MLAEGLWSRSRRRKAHRKRRERKQHFGELVQMDGSFHEWLEERGPRGCLMNMVDDATGTTWCRLGEQETIWAAVGVLRGWIGKYGVPRALYTDWKNVYKRQPSERERLRGEAATTQFGRMCERLGIRILAASSPQAKGRVERNNGVHQDRLVKKLRLQGIQSYAATNQYLEANYLPEHNGRFARAAAEAEDYHAKAPSASRLQEIFRFETERWVSNDWVIQYRGRPLQLQPRSRRYGPTQAKAMVCEWEDGGIEVRYRGGRMEFKELMPATAPEKQQPLAGKNVVRKDGRGKPAKKDHPWRQGYNRKLLPPENRAENFARVGVSACATP